MKFIALFILSLGALAANAQFKYSGTVYDFATGKPMPGVMVKAPCNNNKAFKGDRIEEPQDVVTDMNGYFELDCDSIAVKVEFTFSGFTPYEEVIQSSEPVRILMLEEKYFKDAFLKTSFEAGYYGDVQFAPIGGMVSWSLQSIGNVRLELNTIAKYWKHKENEGKELSAGIYLPIPKRWLPQYAWVSYSEMNYQEENFHLKKIKGLLTFTIPVVTLYVGAAANEQIFQKESGKEKLTYRSGIAGVSMMMDYISLGVYTSLDYYPERTIYQAGVFKSLRRFVISGKYARYPDFNSFQVSVRFGLSSRYYCCYSRVLLEDQFNKLK